MRRSYGLFCLSLMCGVAGLRAQYQFGAADWAIEAQLAAKPTSDIVVTPSPQGDVKAQRFFHEPPGEHFLLIKFSYPMAMLLGGETGVYDKSMTDLTRTRPGQVRSRNKYDLGPYEGEKVLIAQPREKSTRELRMIVIGSSFYVLSAEWPVGNAAAAGHAAAFFASVRLRADFGDARLVEERERWRVFSAGKFRLRYDASRWYRDPADQEPGVFNFLRVDQRAEAQFIGEERGPEDGDIEKAVLNTAREGAASVLVKKRGKKLCGAAQVSELEFEARVEDATYVNHGYFYTGPEGAVQLRGWAKENDYRNVSGDIGELLDGLEVTGR
ncbi:MAG: hypothetical protein JWQ83_250 [Lacunisphaera sp.]|nr:hypothetical protein [Lacunisphaera sp.]